MNYRHLSQEERYQIFYMNQAGYSKKAIAQELGRSSSTIYRELTRECGLRGYRPAQA